MRKNLQACRHETVLFVYGTPNVNSSRGYPNRFPRRTWLSWEHLEPATDSL